MSLDRWELVSERLSRLGIVCTPKVRNRLYWKKRLKIFVDFNRDYYARILGNTSCYVDMNDYIGGILSADNMEERISDFILSHTDDDLFDNILEGQNQQ